MSQRIFEKGESVVSLANVVEQLNIHTEKI